MNYMDIVGIIMTAIGAYLLIYPLQYAVLFIIGMCSKPKIFPRCDEKLKYGMVVAARNEEKVIGGLIDSIRKADYPQDKLEVFVMAHNCTDRTAEIAREHGAIVFEYNNPNEKTKGYALKKAFELIDQNYGISSFDGYHIFDADNILDKDYVTKRNVASFITIKSVRLWVIVILKISAKILKLQCTACYMLPNVGLKTLPVPDWISRLDL